MITGNLFHRDGSRKYLTHDERQAFLTAAAQGPHPVRSFCYVLTYTGCRLAEALALTADRVDLRASRLTFETLKKRKRGVYRTIPVPPDVITMLDFVHNIRRAQARRDRGRTLRLWSWSPVTAWRHVKTVMQRAGIRGTQASPKGLRHGGRAGTHSAQLGPTLVGARAVVNDRYLCRGGRPRGTGNRCADVVITSA